MTPQDNGPRNGDFVRYIDELTARVAANTAATVATNAAANKAARAAPPPTPGAKPNVPARPQTPLTPAFAIDTLGFARLFTIGLFAVGAILVAIGLLATGVEFLFGLGIVMLVWAVRRLGTPRVKA